MQGLYIWIADPALRLPVKVRVSHIPATTASSPPPPPHDRVSRVPAITASSPPPPLHA